MERVVKGLTGYNKEKENKPATHIILTVDEYEQLISECNKAKAQTKQVTEKANKELKNYVNKVNLKMKEVETNTEQKLKAVENRLESYKLEINRLNNLNNNLLRVMKERANADRNIRPKKKRNGYLILNSVQYTYNFYFENRKKRYLVNLPCWRVTIQSYYECSLPFLTIKKEIEKDLTYFSPKLGINNVYNLENVSEEKLYEYWNTEENFIFKATYKQNVRSNFWEVEYLTRASIQIPEDMR